MKVVQDRVCSEKKLKSGKSALCEEHVESAKAGSFNVLFSPFSSINMAVDVFAELSGKIEKGNTKYSLPFPADNKWALLK